MLRVLLLTFFLPGAIAFAGGFDNSGRPFDIIFGDDNALVVNVKYIQPLIDLSVSQTLDQASHSPAITVEHIVSEYIDGMAGIRWQLSDDFACALQFEQPFRFQTRYPDDRLSYQVDAAGDNTQVPAPVLSEYKSRSATLACRSAMTFSHAADSFSMSRLSLIAGPKYQRIEGRFSSDLTPWDLGELDNYRAHLHGSDEWGYLLGLAYEIPELAFRVSVFFHNEIEHSLRGQAYAPLPDLSDTASQPLRGETSTPKALHLNLQSGISEDWLAFLNLRWGDWSSVDEIEVQAGPLSQQLTLFAYDTLNYELGIAVRMSQRLNLGGQFSSLIDLDKPALPEGLSGTNLRNPQAKRYAVGFGGNYSIAESLRLGMSASYYYLQHGRFSDNAYTVKLAASHAFVFSGTVEYLF